MDILICGARGQLGSDCAEVLGSAHRLLLTDIAELDIGDAAAVGEYVRRHRPEMILNCAAHTRVDDCESQHDLADRLNHRGPANLAAAAVEVGAGLIHISTDYVFDGNKALPAAYRETDAPHPVSVYGRTKLAGERAVERIAENFVILRTAWLYGIGGNNFLKTMLRLALADGDRPIRVVNDQHGSPTWSYRLARQIAAMIGIPIRGICHATGAGCGTWYELAKLFLEEMRVRHRLVPCKSEEYPTPAYRPKNSILENRCLKEAGVYCMVDWREDVSTFANRYRNRLISEAGGETP